MNYEEIIEVLKEKFINVSDFAYSGGNETVYEGLGEVEEVVQKGGEGEGSEWYSVKYFKDHDVYIKVEGYYSSYNGTDFDGWEDCSEVKPQEKTITVYE